MKHLFVVRHGNLGHDQRLDDSGRRQMEVLAKVIKDILKGGSAKLISSTAPRALESSEILMAQLALPGCEEIPYLWSGMDAPGDSYYWIRDKDKLMELVNERKKAVDGLVMVTHLEVAEEFPGHYLKKELGRDGYTGGISRGQAAYVDVEGKTCRVLP